MRDAVRRVDGYLGRLLRGLERRAIHDKVNIVIVSDHGMAETNDDRVVVLDDYITLDDIDIIDINPTLGLFPSPGREEAVYRALAGAHPRLRVYRRPRRRRHWHYRDHPRIPPIVGVVDEGWQVLRRATVRDRIGRGLIGPRGEHGYDPRDALSMRGIFVAGGPAFKVAYRYHRSRTSHLRRAGQALGVPPAKNDGDPSVVKSLLRD